MSLKTCTFIFYALKFDNIEHFSTKEYDAVDGKKLLETLIKLYAEQEGVKINYKIEEKEKQKNGV